MKLIRTFFILTLIISIIMCLHSLGEGDNAPLAVGSGLLVFTSLVGAGLTNELINKSK